MTNQPNVFEMFVAHGGPGFWVRRTTWSNTCARVVRVGPLTGRPPYYGNPSVIMDVYSLDGTLRDSAAWLPVPGTYKTWRQIEAPHWAATKQLRPLDDPALNVELAALNRLRNKLGQNPAEVRRRLVVPYERKDEAKRIGAKWDATERTWWLPAHDDVAAAKAFQLGFLPDGPAE